MWHAPIAHGLPREISNWSTTRSSCFGVSCTVLQKHFQIVFPWGRESAVRAVMYIDILFFQTRRIWSFHARASRTTQNGAADINSLNPCTRIQSQSQKPAAFWFFSVSNFIEMMKYEVSYSQLQDDPRWPEMTWDDLRWPEMTWDDLSQVIFLRIHHPPSPGGPREKTAKIAPMALEDLGWDFTGSPYFNRRIYTLIIDIHYVLTDFNL